MGTVQSFTKERLEALENATVVDGAINGSGHLILTTKDGTDIDAGDALVAVPTATTSVHGVVELATSAETSALSDGNKAVTPASLEPTITGLNGRLDDDDTALASLDSRLDAAEASVAVGAGIVGEIRMWSAANAPNGWRLCEGGTLVRADFPVLFALIGTQYGVGDGSTTFNLPDMRGRVVVGYNSADADFSPRGKTGGEKTHTLTSAEMPAHTHTQNSHNHGFPNGASGALTDGSAGTGYGTPNGTFYGFKAQNTAGVVAVNQNTGGGGAHNNVQPYIAIKFIIRVA